MDELDEEPTQQLSADALWEFLGREPEITLETPRQEEADHRDAWRSLRQRARAERPAPAVVRDRQLLWLAVTAFIVSVSLMGIAFGRLV
jgi:hypothetical protein